MESKFLKLINITKEFLELDVSKYVEEKNKLKYLSWANAIKEALKVDPEFEYSIIKNEEGIPIFGNAQLGYMVYTTVTFQGKTRECWLPVMDGANKPMKDEAYTYEVADWKWDNNLRKKVKVGTKEKDVEPLDMFNINKTVMRCLTKNLAMFGLGLYIYAGEDLPEDESQEAKIVTKKQEEPKKQAANNNVLSEKQLKMINAKINNLKCDREKIKKKYQVFSLSELSKSQASELIKILKERESKNK